MSDSPLVVVVDDDLDVRLALAGLLSSTGYAVECFPSAAEFLQSYVDLRADVVVCDYNMPGMTGVELCAEAKSRTASLPFILITAFATKAVRQSALNVGIATVLEKPFDPAMLLGEISLVLDRSP